MFKKYLEIATKEKKAEGLWSGGKPESQEKDTTKKEIYIPADMDRDIISYKKNFSNIKKLSKADLMVEQNRFVLYNGEIYGGKAKLLIHDYIVGWLIFNKGLVMNDQEFENWHKSPVDKFYCLQQYPMYNKLIGLSESYTDSRARELNFEFISKSLEKILEKEFKFVPSKISKYWVFDKILQGEK